MQATCSSLETAHLLRGILQTKENYPTQFMDNNNSSPCLKDLYTRGCSSEVISDLLLPKSGYMTYSGRDTDTELDNEPDVDVATDTHSLVHSGDQSDDLDERSPDTCSNEDVLRSVDQNSFLGESKEVKRAHVDNILTSMRRSSPLDTMDSSNSLLAGDYKRQKRKQHQPQQHESNSLHSEELALERQIKQLKEQMRAVKRRREDEPLDEDEGDYGLEEDEDFTDGGSSSRPDSLPSSPVTKREIMEHMMTGNQSPTRDQLDKSSEVVNHVSPSGDSSKRQKRKQTQPQQHDTSKRSSELREGGSMATYQDHERGFSCKTTEGQVGVEDDGAELTNHSALYDMRHAYRNIYPGLTDTDLLPPFPHGFDPQFYRDSFLRHNFLAIRQGYDPLLAFRNVSKFHRSRNNSAPSVEVNSKGQTSHIDVSKLAGTLKAELTAAVSKAIDGAVSKVLSQKHTDGQHGQASESSESGHQTKSSERYFQHSQNHQQLQLHHQKHRHPLNSFHHLFQSSQQFQQQQQNRVLPHQQLQTAGQDREAEQDATGNPLFRKKPDSAVPFSEHLHFLERFGNRFPQDKVSAFDSGLGKQENEFITPHAGPSLPFHPHFPYYLPPQVLTPLFPGEPEQTEALSLIVNTPKKKRTKVTDTRLSSPRGKASVLQDNTPSSSMDPSEAQRHLAVTFPHFLPPVMSASVAALNHHPNLTHADFLAARLRESTFGESGLASPQEHSRTSPRSLDESPAFMTKVEMYDRGNLNMATDMDGGTSGNGLLTSTLTPMHLRKAKLMFFYTRYPSSSILKMYFPDVMFNKNNTAQLVKWFSNFREFFYIQMEKYARQALAEGCKQADELMVTADSELFRHLNLHYNRNNQLEVPPNFVAAVQAALREFFKSIQSNKDAEPSWKKAIYKVIARMDETLPDFFKSPNWMEQLGDQ